MDKNTYMSDGTTEIGIEPPVVNEYELDLNNLPKVKHNWIKRGIVVSCENACHPNHRHFLTNKRDIAPEL